MKNSSRNKKKKIIYSKQKSLETFDKELSAINYDYKEIYPAFKEQNIPIVIVSSEEYSPFAAVVIQSIITNSSIDYNYDIVLLSDDILLRSTWRIQNLAGGYSNISVRIIDISNLVKDYNFFTWAHFTKNTYFRLLTPDLFINYDKVIYLDSDVVVNHDISELYKIDIGKNFIGAAYDTHVVSYCSQKPPLDQREYNIKTLGLKNPEEYYQMGVSIFNIQAFRNNFNLGYLITEATKVKLQWLDQDLMNKLFQGKIKRIPTAWNVMIANMAEFIDEYYLPKDLRIEYFEARKNPKIIHYVGRAIPCYTTTPDLYEYFWKYARLTPFYEILLQRMVVDYVNKWSNDHLQNLNNNFLKNNDIFDKILNQHQEMYLSYQNSLRKRVRRAFTPLLNKIFPINTRRRELIRHIYNKLAGWE